MDGLPLLAQTLSGEGGTRPWGSDPPVPQPDSLVAERSAVEPEVFPQHADRDYLRVLDSVDLLHPALVAEEKETRNEALACHPFRSQALHHSGVGLLYCAHCTMLQFLYEKLARAGGSRESSQLIAHGPFHLFCYRLHFPY